MPTTTRSPLPGAPPASELEETPLDAERSALLGRIAREATKLARRVKAVQGDLERGCEAEAVAEGARLFVAEAARAPRGTKTLTAVDWSTGEPRTRVLELDPAKKPRDQVEALFAQARRLKRGAAVGAARIEEAKGKLARLAALREVAAEAATVDELVAAERAARAEDPALLPVPREPRKTGTGAGKGPGKGRRVPYRAFVTESGARILVGKGAGDNDELTLHVARPRDLWMHTKDLPGAHVVVPLDKGREPPPELLVDAAHLAAHFSEAREEAIVDVAYTHKRYVRKPRKAAPGLVIVDREKVIALRVDPVRLRLLLAREEGGP